MKAMICQSYRTDQGMEIWQDAICTAQNMDGVVKKIKAVPCKVAVSKKKAERRRHAAGSGRTVAGGQGTIQSEGGHQAICRRGKRRMASVQETAAVAAEEVN